MFAMTLLGSCINSSSSKQFIDPSLIGHWSDAPKGDLSSSQKQFYTSQIIFYENGTYQCQITYSYNEDGEPITHAAPFSEFGTYTTSENIILLNGSEKDARYNYDNINSLSYSISGNKLELNAIMGSWVYSKPNSIFYKQSH